MTHGPGRGLPSARTGASALLASALVRYMAFPEVKLSEKAGVLSDRSVTVNPFCIGAARLGLRAIPSPS